MPLGRDANGQIIQAMRPSTNQQITVTAASAQTANPLTKQYVRLCSSTACRIAVGPDPTAAATSMRLPANVIDYITIHPGDKIAAIREAADGTLTVTEMD